MQTYLTTSTAGVPAPFDSCEEDFEVTEIPLYEPSDEGEHLYINFKKRGLTTRQVIRRAVELFGVEERNVGYAGLKDKNATTIQTISVHGISEAQAAQLADEHVEILWARLHRNKLRVGHLAGNRFRVRLRNTESAALVDAQAVLTTLAQQGLPNFYGRRVPGAKRDTFLKSLKATSMALRVSSSHFADSVSGVGRIILGPNIGPEIEISNQLNTPPLATLTMTSPTATFENSPRRIRPAR